MAAVSVDYQSYMQSAAWRNKRRQLTELYGESCEFCGEDEVKLNVHHLTYETLGHESTVDVCVLCWSCHADAHELPKIAREIEAVIERRRR